MKVSEFIRQWQLTGAVPDTKEPALAFWAGTLIGAGLHTHTVVTLEEARTFAIRAAEFIEERCRT
jgi:hypothetical protein